MERHTIRSFPQHSPRYAATSIFTYEMIRRTAIARTSSPYTRALPPLLETPHAVSPTQRNACDWSPLGAHVRAFMHRARLTNHTPPHSTQRKDG
jgi:hypothetical protein